jgi:hypothetical protein
LSVDGLTGFLWRELGSRMRRVRQAAGVSIRAAETRSGYSRGMLSLAENGRARPGRDLVRWYDEEFAANGLLLSLYAEAFTAAVLSTARVTGAPNRDALSLTGCDPACGVVVAPGAHVAARWTLRNTGKRRWTGRRLERLGPIGGSLVLASSRHVDVPTTAPGAEATVECEIVAPHRRGSYIGCWAMVDGCVPSQDAVVFFTVVVG